MRFAVLHHTGWPGHDDHYDILLQNAVGASEDDRVLLAFATRENRFPAAGALLLRRDNHRRLYLEHEGDVGGGRGNVARADEGALESIAQDGKSVAFTLCGKKLIGSFRIVPLEDGSYSLQAVCPAD
jgi:hypothetical protein